MKKEELQLGIVHQGEHVSQPYQCNACGELITDDRAVSVLRFDSVVKYFHVRCAAFILYGGKKMTIKWEECPACGGTEEHIHGDEYFYSSYSTPVDCPYCRGAGIIPSSYPKISTSKSQINGLRTILHNLKTLIERNIL